MTAHTQAQTEAGLSVRTDRATLLDALATVGPVVVLVCDIPFVEPPLVQLLAQWPGAGTVIPQCRGRLQRMPHARAKSLTVPSGGMPRLGSGCDGSPPSTSHNVVDRPVAAGSNDDSKIGFSRLPREARSIACYPHLDLTVLVAHRVDRRAHVLAHGRLAV